MTITGAELKALREKLGLTQKQLAAEVGLTATSIGRFEQPNGRKVYPVPHWLGLLMFHMVKDAEAADLKKA